MWSIFDSYPTFRKLAKGTFWWLYSYMGEQYLPKRLGFRSVDPEAARLHQDAYEPQSDWAMNIAPIFDEEIRSFRTIDYLDFLMSGPVPDRVIPNLEKVEGRWHPSGFMVFPLGEHPDLGFVRLHVWPEGLRRREERGRGKIGNIWDGDIHNHAWHVTSYVIGGYRDTLYDIEQVVDLSNRNYEEIATDALRHFRIFRAQYDKATGEDVLVTNGQSVVVTSKHDRGVYFPTDVHQIKVGDYHAPTIPDNEFAATLAFNSHRVNRYGPEILIGGAATFMAGSRRRVTEDEKLFAKAQLLDAMDRLEAVERAEGRMHQLPTVTRQVGHLALVPDLPNINADAS